MLPTLFVSHGAPTFAVEPGIAGPQLAALGRRFGNDLPRPRAVLVISPHWQATTVQVTTAAHPETIHDFGGFPPALYALQYPAPGAPEIAAEVIAELAANGIDARANATRGLDHGAWVPLMYLFPDADVPVVQLALPRYSNSRETNPRDYIAFGHALAALRARDLLVIGSGSLTHNLHEIYPGDDVAQRWATEFAHWIRDRIDARDLDALADYRQRAPEAQRAHPTDEHLMPLYVALGAAGDDWVRNRHIDGGMSYGTLSMDAYVFGEG